MYYPTEDLNLNIARGLVKSTRSINIFGYNSNVGINFIPLWENNTAYTYPNNALQMVAVSTSTSDTNVTIKIDGLDEDYNEITDNVTLTGTTPIVINTNFFRINNVITISGNASGNVEISNNSIVYAKIRAGEGKNQASIYTVPANHCFYLQRIDAFSATALSNKYLFFRNFLTLTNGVNLRVAETTFVNNMNIHRITPFKYDQKTDIMLEGKSSTQTNEMGVFAEGILLREPLT